MKTTNLIRVSVAVAMVSGFVSLARALTPADAASVLYIKQEEKVARDAYQALYVRWGHITFANIAASEQQHMAAMDGLIARYKLADTTPAAAGKFTIPELQALYDELVAFGSQSLEDALRVGVLIENTDIADLQTALQATREKPIKNVLSNLLNGSYNHLGAFNRALAQ